MRFTIDQEQGFLCPEELTKTTTLTAISKLPDFKTPQLNPQYPFSAELHQLLSGRKLLLQEIPFPITILHEHYLNGYVTFHRGIVDQTCVRCGNKEKHLFASHQCARCNDNCHYCRHCIQMGKVSECSPLVSWSGPLLLYPSRDRALQWQGTLSEGQQKASDQIKLAVGTSSTNLIWAVCGAGKTEILFEGINKAVELGQHVLIATPRSDVVHELTPRLKAVFPTVDVISLFGGSEDRGKQGQLVIATTHQLLRYDRHFDFVVIDEVDAFPYSYDPMLKYAVQQASKKQATTILLTATPDKYLQRQVRKKEIETVKIPRRYHGHPLPIPSLQWSGNWKKLLSKAEIPKPISEWLKKLTKTNQQAFLFVPTITVLETLVPLLQNYYPTIEGVHSEDPDRREKVQKFRNNEIQILTTTTILERGVTVPNISVAVFGADDDVFTESALVQISGRVGRSADYPTGEIVFFHYGKTEAMLDAVDHIKHMNRLGGR